MNTPSMNRLRPTNDHPEDDEPRDTGTFKATLPALGGFLTADGQPIEPAPQDKPTPRVTLPFYCEGEEPGSRLGFTVTSTLLVISIVTLLLVALLLYVLCDDAIGQADGLLSVLRTSVR